MQKSNNIFVLKKEEKEKKEISQEKYNILINNPVLIFFKEEFCNKNKKEVSNNNENDSYSKNEKKEKNIEKIDNDYLSLDCDEQPVIDKKKLRRGRWTDEEHRNFLKGIIKYGNDWKMVEKIVKTRTSSQSRSHAQKYFLKFKNIVERNNFNENNLYEFITGEFSLSCFWDINLAKLNFEEKKKLANAFISYSNIFEKNKRRKKSVDNSNKLKAEPKNDDNRSNRSFHSDEDDDEISLINDQKNILNNKRKRTDVKINKNKIFNIVKSVKYKNSEDYSKNNNNDLNNKINNNKNNNIKCKFLVEKNKSEKKSNNKGNNNKNSSKVNNNYIINNNIFNINNTNNFDLNSLNIFNCNINTININNINYINNETNRNIIENSDKNIFDKLDNNILSFSQKNLSYDFLRPNYKNYNEENMFENEEEELSSFDKRNKTYFISPL